MVKIIYNNKEKKHKNEFIHKENNTNELPKIQLSSEFIKKYGLNTNKVMIKFGNWTNEFLIYKNNNMSEQEIGIPKDIVPFTIPKQLSYDIKVEGNTIHIGPFIAFIAKKSFNNLSMKRLERYKNRFNHFVAIGGLVIICSSDSIDILNQTITGYYFNPNAKSVNERWLKGVFPYPDSIFKKIRIPVNKELNLKRAIGNKIFNTNFFNKLDLWEACSTNEKVQKMLPVTKKYETVDDLKEMLDRFNTVYLKPIRGMQGNGIYMVKQDKNGILLINNRKEKIILKSIYDVKQYIGKILIKDYLIQQGIPTIYKNKHFDFRLYFQKNEMKQWVCQGSIGRVAQEESIVTNLNHIAHLSSGEKAVKIVFKVSDSEAKAIMNNTIESCKELCNLLDKKLGHFGDVAIDVIIDHNHMPWVLEVNNLYGKKSLHLLNENEILNKLHTTPLEYAKALAGF